MSSYKKFRVESINNEESFLVQVKGWIFWKSGYVFTDYFSISYDSRQEAMDSIELYKNRFTEVL